jgi:hypothetical protein
MSQLLGGTTGQVLAKTSATNMAFTWTTPQVGDITGVTAGTGISGGGTSGTVTVTNDMATTITTNGDLIYGTGSGTYTRRAIGSTSQVLTVAGGIPTWATPAAAASKIIQVVTATTTTQTATSSSTFSDTSLTVTITPTLATSTILVLIAQNGVGKNTGNTGTNLRLLRDSTTISTFGSVIGLNGVANENWMSAGLCYIDSPATTSATTYKTQEASSNNIAQVVTQVGSAMSTITLMEIGA